MSEEKINDFGLVSDQIMSKSLEFLGQLGVAKAGIQVLPKYWTPKLQRGVVRVDHKHVDKLKSALNFIQKIKNKKIILKSVGVSGILNKAKEKYLTN